MEKERAAQALRDLVLRREHARLVVPPAPGGAVGLFGWHAMPLEAFAFSKTSGTNMNVQTAVEHNSKYTRIAL